MGHTAGADGEGGTTSLTTCPPSNPCGTKSGISATDHSELPASDRADCALDPGPFYPLADDISKLSIHRVIEVIEPFGRNGAALAALGDMVLGLFGVDPFAANNVGVKLGESTFNPFLVGQETQCQRCSSISTRCCVRCFGSAPVRVLTCQFGFDSATSKDRG